MVNNQLNGYRVLKIGDQNMLILKNSYVKTLTTTKSMMLFLTLKMKHCLKARKKW